MRRAVPWGGRGSGGPAPPSTLSYPPSGPSPAPPLVWGLGLWPRRVVPAVAPVGEGAAQSPGEPVVGVRIRDAEHRSPFQEGRPRRLTDLRTLSWSSGAAHPPGGTSRFPPSLWRSTASKGRFLDLLEVPWLAWHNHPDNSPTRGRVSSPRGSGTAPQSRSHGRPSSAPRAGPPRCPCACGADAAPRPPSAETIRTGSALGAGVAGWCWCRGGWGGTSSPASRSML